jgi:uncharacterized membrane protein YedE/YeeE
VRRLLPLLSGLLFALGLGISGMTDPRKVLGFLDVAGAWDPSLALVMGGALLVYLPFVQLLARTRPAVRPLEDGRLGAPLLVGAAVFGVGWGLTGYCPGPALVSLATGQLGVLVFAAAMFAGMAAANATGRVAADAACA